MEIKIWEITRWPEFDLVLRLVVAALLGGLVGFEREHAEKPADVERTCDCPVGTFVRTYQERGWWW